MANNNTAVTNNIKTPYWAGTEGATHSASIPPQTTERRATADGESDGSGYTYNFVANPYSNTQPGTPPHFITAEELDTLEQSGVRESCWARQRAHENAQPVEPALSRGLISDDGRPPAAMTNNSRWARRRSSVTESVKSTLGSVRRAASTAKRSLSRHVRVPSSEVKVSSPVPGSFHRNGDSHALAPMEGVPALELIGLEQAQATFRKHGQPDHELAAISAAAVTQRASAIAAAERAAFGDSPVQSPPASARSIPRKPVPASPATVAAPVHAPAMPTRNPRRVVAVSRDTMWGEFMDAGMDDSWVTQPQYQVQGEDVTRRTGKGKGRATEPAPPVSDSPGPAPMQTGTNHSPASSGSMSKHPNANNKLPSTHVLRHVSRMSFAEHVAAHDQSSADTSGMPLAEALASQGLRRASYVPGVKCSDCGGEVHVDAAADHDCPKPAPLMSRPTSTNTQPPRNSRESVYAANYREFNHDSSSSSASSRQSARSMSINERPPPKPGWEDGELEVVVDTYLEDDHTSWVGVVRSADGAVASSHQVDLGSGLQGQREYEGYDAVRASRVYRRLLEIG